MFKISVPEYMLSTEDSYRVQGKVIQNRKLLNSNVLKLVFLNICYLLQIAQYKAKLFRKESSSTTFSVPDLCYLLQIDKFIWNRKQCNNSILKLVCLNLCTMQGYLEQKIGQEQSFKISVPVLCCLLQIAIQSTRQGYFGKENWSTAKF